VVGEQAHSVRQLTLGGVHAAGKHVQYQVHAFVVGQSFAGILGGQQVADQVVGRVCATITQ
jgi:hypothetical protein